MFITSGEKWIKRRKLILPSFHLDILKNYSQTINEEADILIEQLLKQDLNREIYLLPFLTSFSLDTICCTAMGESLNVQLNHDLNYPKAINKILNIIHKRRRSPWLWNNFIFSLTRLSKEQNKCLEVLHEFTRNIIKKRIDDYQDSSGAEKRMSFLDTLINAWKQDPQSLTLDDIQEEVDTFMFGGHDTTSTALNWTLFALATHSKVQTKLHLEINRVFGDTVSHISNEDLKKLDYLDCVVKESLRLFPAGPFLSRQLTEDTEINNKKILKGAQAIIFIYQIHRDESIFENAYEFKPERFLSSNPNTNEHPYAYIPFSAGRRNCIGQKLAVMELKIALVKILQRFEIECDQKFKDLGIKFETVLRSEKNILFKFKKNKSF